MACQRSEASAFPGGSANRVKGTKDYHFSSAFFFWTPFCISFKVQKVVGSHRFPGLGT